jgi:hypothetical protein
MSNQLNREEKVRALALQAAAAASGNGRYSTEASDVIRLAERFKDYILNGVDEKASK